MTTYSPRLRDVRDHDIARPHDTLATSRPTPGRPKDGEDSDYLPD